MILEPLDWAEITEHVTYELNYRERKVAEKAFALGAKMMQGRAATWADEMSAKVAPHCRTNTVDNFGWGMAEIAYKNAAEAIRSWKVDEVEAASHREPGSNGKS